jgi:hypothetical protein
MVEWRINMKRKTIFIIAVLMLVGLTCSSAQTKAQLQEMYVSWLRAEGYSPSVDSDGDVNFTAQGHRFYISVRDEDLQSFQLVLTEFLDITPASNRLKALEAASAETRTTRVIRIYMTSSGKIAIDAFILLAKPDDFKVHLKRLVDLILLGRKDYLARMS